MTVDPRLTYGDEATRERVNAGAARARPQLDLFYDVMAHELEANAHKGDAADQPALAHVKELFYHAAKLYMAVLFGQREAALEYAADCGNHAWMAAESAHVLDLDLLTAGLEGHASAGLYEQEAESPGEFIDEHELERLVRERPWVFKASRGGFYDRLKAVSIEFGGRLQELVGEEQLAHGRVIPDEREALGAKT